MKYMHGLGYTGQGQTQVDLEAGVRKDVAMCGIDGTEEEHGML